MKFLMISNCGEGAQVLYNIGLEGNEIRLFIKEPDYRRNWRGLISQVSLNSSWIDKDTTIIFDMSGMGDRADSLRNSGYKVFGASKFHDKLEHDRAFGLEFMEKNGIKVPETQEFKNLDSAQEYIKASKKRLVFKPSGDNLPCHLTYCSSDSEDLIEYLDYVFSYYKGAIHSFVLQEFIEGKILSTEIWCDGETCNFQANHSIELKKYGSGELGPSTGCQGNLVWATDDDIFVEKLLNIEDDLVKNRFIGQIDLNAIYDGKDIYGLEWTPRFGYDSIPTILPLISGDLGKLYYSFARGNGDLELLEDVFSGGVRFTIPPYPIESFTNNAVQKVSPNLGIPIRGFKQSQVKDLYFYEIMTKNGKLVHGDGTGVIGVASCLGETPKAAFDLAYNVVKGVKIPDVYYRSDLGDKICEMYEEIKGVLNA